MSCRVKLKAKMSWFMNKKIGCARMSARAWIMRKKDWPNKIKFN